MTREEAIEKLNDCIDNDDTEGAHRDGDHVLTEMLRFLGYADIADTWNKIKKWYA